MFYAFTLNLFYTNLGCYWHMVGRIFSFALVVENSVGDYFDLIRYENIIDPVASLRLGNLKSAKSFFGAIRCLLRLSPSVG